MERLAYKSILEWKSSPNRKPLILSGARQVGKTWLLKEFGRREYASCIYINCDKDAFAADLFRDYDVKRIEVKAAENLNSKSLKTFVTANKGLHGVRFSLAPYREQDWMRNIPLYAVSAFFSR
jgi:MoxR-like ATPase